jgi:hypothetical protein
VRSSVGKDAADASTRRQRKEAELSAIFDLMYFRVSLAVSDGAIRRTVKIGFVLPMILVVGVCRFLAVCGLHGNQSGEYLKRREPS